MRIIQGNILQAKENVIAHQVNCMGVMGAGLAKQIRSNYPIVFKKYKEMIRHYGHMALGKSQIITVGNGRYVCNLYGQINYGRVGKYTDYGALRSAFQSLSACARTHGLTVAIPYNIGCGLAGGNWDIVQSIIEEQMNGVDYTIYKY